MTVNSQTDESVLAAETAGVRRSYSQPRLVQYGDVRELTEANSGSLNEGSAMVAMMRFP